MGSIDTMSNASQNTVDPTAAPMATFGGAPVPPKRKKGVLVASIVAGVAAVLIGGSAFAYNGWYQDPQKVIGDAIGRAVTAETIDAQLVVDVTQTIRDDSGHVTFDVGIKMDGSQVQLDLGYDVEQGGRTASMSGSAILADDGAMYGKINNPRELVTELLFNGNGSTLGPFEGLVQKIDGSWIVVEKGDLAEVSGDLEKSRTCYQEFGASLSENKAWAKEVGDIYKKNTFFVVKEKLGAQTINGVSSLGYRIGMDAAKIRSFVTSFGQTEAGKKLQSCDETLNYDEAAEAFSDDLSLSDDTNLHIWVSRFAHELTQIDVSRDDEDMSGKIVLQTKFNKDITITKPTKTISIDELKAEIEKISTPYYTSSFQASTSI